MEALVRFRQSADTLAEHEYNLLIKSIDKNDLLQALFHFYYKQFEENDDCTKVKQINNKISEIFHKRNKSDKLENIELPSPQLHNIAQPLINHISSYLVYSDVSSFERVCRRMYIASKSPQHLYNVDVSQLEKYVDYCKKHDKLVHFNKFSAAQCLKFDFAAYPLLIFNNPFTLNNLIAIDGLDDACIETFLSSDNISLQKIKRLNLSSVSDLSDLFQRTPNLEILSFNDVALDHLDLSNEITKNIIGKLKALQCTESCISSNHVLPISDMINLCGAQLQALGLFDLVSFNLNINFKKLISVIEFHLSIQADTILTEMIHFVNYFKNLQRVHLLIFQVTHDFKQLFGKLLTTIFGLDSLECIEFEFCVLDSNPHTEIMVLRFIEEALMITTKKRLKISITMAGHRVIIHEQIEFYFSSLTNSLCSEIQDDFMLVVKMCKERVNTEIKENIKNWLDKRKQKLFVEYDINDIDSLSFVVCNKQCKINGYSQKWILKYIID